MSKSKKNNSIMKWIASIVIVTALVIGNNWGLFTNSNSTEETPQQAVFNQSRTTGMEIPIHSKSESKGQVISRTGYTLSYNDQMRTPNWVAWELTREETRGKEERSTEFYPDPQVKGKKVEMYDYSRSGYDRGHMAPAGDMKWNGKAMKESFYMSNICPQNKELNKGDWNDLEIKTREWTRRYGKAYIACGPIYIDGKSIKTIGSSQVAVPHAFFKAILINKKGTPIAMGFYFKNESGHRDLQEYLISIDELEKLTNLDFFSLLPDEVENKIEKTAVKELP